MASVEKFTAKSVAPILRHCERTAKNHANQDIDPEKKEENYKLSPDHGMSDYDYFLSMQSSFYSINRSDVIKMATWVVSAPDDLAPEQEEMFFRTTRYFLLERYGKENEIQCVVHKDEIHDYIDNKTGTVRSSRAHLHYSFMPTIYDPKKDCFRFCAKKVLNPKDLRNFHQDLQRYLDTHGIRCTVYSGITKQNGGNRTIKELKKDSKKLDFTIKKTHERNFEF